MVDTLLGINSLEPEKPPIFTVTVDERKKISVFWEDSIFSEVAVIGKDGTKQTKTDFFFD